MRPPAFRWGHWAACSLLLLGPVLAQGQPWSGVLDPSRAFDWRAFPPGVRGGLPTRATICATLSPGVTAAQITSALGACATGGVVQLTAGTYTLTGGITFGTKSNVTLRGAGADQTKLVFSGSINCFGLTGLLCVQANWIDPGGPPFVTNWTAGYSVGTTEVTLASVAGLTVGEILVLDQLNDATDTGGIFVCNSASCSEEAGGGNQRVNRAQQHYATVSQIAGNVVTLSLPLTMPNWRSGQSPQAIANPTTRISGNGIEDLSVDASLVGGGVSAIVFLHAADVWVKGVRVLNPGRSHVWMYQTMRATVRDSYFYGGQTGGATSYGVESYGGASILVENNIFQHVTAPIANNSADTGSVYAYNFTIDDNYTVSPSFMVKSIMLHDAGSSMNLYEGNDGLGFTHDDIHGTTHFQTLLRNHFYGDVWNSPAKTASTDPVSLSNWGRFVNIVGNVLGRPGYYTSYQSDGTEVPTAIFTFGWSRQGFAPDTQTRATSLRWGNYDTVTGTVRWCGHASNTGWSTTCTSTSEVPTGLAQYSNAVPAQEQIPASFYLHSKPAWFGAVPWPPIGPDVSGGSASGYDGHVHKIPARLCWESLAADGAQPYKVFTPRTCYQSVSGPAVHRLVP